MAATGSDFKGPLRFEVSMGAGAEQPRAAPSRQGDAAAQAGCPVFGVLLLNWNDHQNVVASATALIGNSYHPMKIYVIDNGSRPESVQYIKARLRGPILIENGRNLGFCGGFNAGIRRALEDDIDIICVLNSDLRVEQGFLWALAEAFEDPGVAAAAPLELDFHNPTRVVSAGGSLNPVRNRRFGYGERESALHRAAGDTHMLCGAAMVFRARTLRTLGGFDERLFFGGEDHEMTLRILRAGLRIRYVPAARFWHMGGLAGGGGGTPLMAYFGVRNYLLVARWYGTRVERLKALAMVLTVRIPRLIARATRERDLRYVKGLGWSLLWFINTQLVPADAEVAEILSRRTRLHHDDPGS